MIAVRGLLRGDGLAGVVIGVLAGAAFGAWMGAWVKRTTRDLPELPLDQATEVGRAIRRGEAPPDPSLAPATIERARRIQERNSQAWPYLVMGAFAAMSVGLAVSNLITDSLTTQDVLLAAFWLVFLPLLAWGARRARTRASSAEAAARRMIDTPPAP